MDALFFDKLNVTIPLEGMSDDLVAAAAAQNGRVDRLDAQGYEVSSRPTWAKNEFSRITTLVRQNPDGESFLDIDSNPAKLSGRGRNAFGEGPSRGSLAGILDQLLSVTQFRTSNEVEPVRLVDHVKPEDVRLRSVDFTGMLYCASAESARVHARRAAVHRRYGRAAVVFGNSSYHSRFSKSLSAKVYLKSEELEKAPRERKLYSDSELALIQSCVRAELTIKRGFFEQEAEIHTWQTERHILECAWREVFGEMLREPLRVEAHNRVRQLLLDNGVPRASADAASKYYFAVYCGGYQECREVWSDRVSRKWRKLLREKAGITGLENFIGNGMRQDVPQGNVESLPQPVEVPRPRLVGSFEELEQMHQRHEKECDGSVG